MDFHFAKHLSPLVLASEREMSFDCAATAASRWALWLPCQWPALHRVARWGAATGWGAWLRGCGRAPTGVHLTPSPVQGAAPETGQVWSHQDPSSGVLPPPDSM